MDIHIALHEGLEKLVREKIESGQYQPESELACPALRLHFYQPTKGEVLDSTVLPRLEALKNGSLGPARGTVMKYSGGGKVNANENL